MAVSFRVRCRGPLPQLSLTEAGARPAGAARKGTRAAWFDGGFVDTPVYDRYALAHGARIAGPAIIEEREATTIIPPGDTRHRRCNRHAGDRHRPRRRAGRARHRGHADRTGRRADRGRSGFTRNHVEPPRHRGRGDVAHDLPHRLLADRLRGAGLRLRPARRTRQFAGPFAARHAGVQPDAAARGEGAAGEIPARDAEARRRAGHQRSVALRRASVRHRRGHAGVPQRRAGGADRHRRPCRRHRRHQGQPAGARDLRGRHPDPADDAVSRGRAER